MNFVPIDGLCAAALSARSTRLLRFMLGGLALLGPVSLRAQSPDSLAGQVFRHHRYVMGVSILSDFVDALNNDGTVTGLYRSTSIDSAPLEPRNGTYAYLKTGVATATLTLTYPSSPDTILSLAFTSETAGTFTFASSAGSFFVKPLVSTSPLVNTSQRSRVTESEPGIIGLVVPPGQETMCLIRAVGPGLAAFPGTTPAADPRLEVFHGSLSLEQNNDWEVPSRIGTPHDGQRATITAVGTLVGAFPLAPNSKDAAIVMLLGPGNYTVHIRTSTGEPRAEVLGEIYVVY